MAKRPKTEYWHKKQGKTSSVSSQAVHSSVKDGHPLLNPSPKPSRAEMFLRNLKTEIKKAL
ncbi:MAG: hypothetical protein HQL16_04150 [Candidatus Omnitrophica bacterium]|nr:hypothetical protein [Candidatus Omnitrophota bacterium]